MFKAPIENYAKGKAQEVIFKHFTRPIQQHANRKIVELLIGYGANVNYRLNDGRTPFDMALAIGNELHNAKRNQKFENIY